MLPIVAIEYSVVNRVTGSIPCLLKPWLLASPGHQQPWYWICRINGPSYPTRNDFIYLHHLILKVDRKCKTIFMFPKIYSAWQGLKIWKIFLWKNAFGLCLWSWHHFDCSRFNSSNLLCDCQLSWLPHWLTEAGFRESVNARCSHPDMLKGKSIFDVRPNDFKCSEYLLHIDGLV